MLQSISKDSVFLYRGFISYRDGDLAESYHASLVCFKYGGVRLCVLDDEGVLSIYSYRHGVDSYLKLVDDRLKTDGIVIESVAFKLGELRRGALND
ncbi:MAG: hypothetical protein QW320_06600 [Ignisphaera sp.]|uniref:hypothetical protein n=1 Tax=Thermofilum sp. TaxID=1961369 RepID=UPI00316A0861